MSVQAFSWVIEKSQHGGSPLLVLLLIANHTQSDGTGAFPSIELLAREARMSERGIKYVIHSKLIPSGELVVDKKSHLEEGDGRLYGRKLYSIPGVIKDGFHLPKIASRAKNVSAKIALTDENLSATAIAPRNEVVSASTRNVSASTGNVSASRRTILSTYSSKEKTSDDDPSVTVIEPSHSNGKLDFRTFKKIFNHEMHILVPNGRDLIKRVEEAIAPYSTEKVISAIRYFADQTKTYYRENKPKRKYAIGDFLKELPDLDIPSEEDAPKERYELPPD